MSHAVRPSGARGLAVVVVAMAVVIAGAPSASAQSIDSGALTLDAVIASAISMHPNIVAASADIDGGEAELLAAEGAFDPTLKVEGDGGAGNYLSGGGGAGVSALTPFGGTKIDGGWRLGVGDYPTYYGKEKTNDFGEFSLGVSVPILRGFAIDSARAGVERRGIDVARRRQLRQVSELDLARAAAADYYDWVAAGAKLNVARSLLALAERRDDQLKRRADVGDSAAIDVIDNARLIAQRQSRVVAARRGFERAALKLALSLRDDDGRVVIPHEGRVPQARAWGPQQQHAADVIDADEDVSELVNTAVSARPELEALRQALKDVGVEARLADNNVLPSLRVGAKVSQDVGDTHPPLSSSSSVWNPDPKTRALPDAGVSLSFEMPAFLRTARGQVGVVDAKRRKLEASLFLARDKIELEVRDSLQAQRAAAERAAFAATEAAAARDVLAGESSRYEAGDSTLVVVNLREVAVAEAELAAIDASVDVERARAITRLVLGQLPRPSA